MLTRTEIDIYLDGDYLGRHSQLVSVNTVRSWWNVNCIIYSEVNKFAGDIK